MYNSLYDFVTLASPLTISFKNLTFRWSSSYLRLLDKTKRDDSTRLRI